MMETVLYYLAAVVLSICTKASGRAISNQNIGLNIGSGVSEYLQRFGYMANTKPNNVGEINSGPDIAESIRSFQQWNNLPITGELDAATKKLMSTPRCGVPDPQPIPGMPKPYVLGPKWTRNTLTYKFLNFSPDLSSTVIRSETERAFKFWTDVANLGISETAGTADITLLFASGDHGDISPFDGAGGVLAHAWFPQDGRCHFDESETWVVNTTGIDYFLIAAHEIGHILGLDHSNSQSALMYPYYGGYIPNYIIDADDKAAIIAQYGVATTTMTPTTEQVTSASSLTTTDDLITTKPSKTSAEITTDIETTTYEQTTSDIKATNIPTTTYKQTGTDIPTKDIATTNAATTNQVQVSSDKPTTDKSTTDKPTTTSVQTTTNAQKTHDATTDNMETTDNATTTEVVTDKTTTNIQLNTKESSSTDVPVTADRITVNIPLNTEESSKIETLAPFPETTASTLFRTDQTSVTTVLPADPKLTAKAQMTIATDPESSEVLTSIHMTKVFSTSTLKYASDHFQTSSVREKKTTDETGSTTVSISTMREGKSSKETTSRIVGTTDSVTVTSIGDTSTSSTAAIAGTLTFTTVFVVTGFNIKYIMNNG